jgi:hypothetical protein
MLLLFLISKFPINFMGNLGLPDKVYVLLIALAWSLC